MCQICQTKKASFGQKFFAWASSKSDETQHNRYGRRKYDLFKNLSGKVLEIGPGTGVNFEYYPNHIEWIGLEPSTAMQSYLKRKAKERMITTTILSEGAEHIPFPDESVDYVICTLVLCSVRSQETAVAEIKRVLKSGGKFIFIEHVGATKGSTVRKVQEFLRPLWKILADGCDPARDTGRTLDHAGFADVSYELFDQAGAFGIKIPHIAGEAIK